MGVSLSLCLSITHPHSSFAFVCVCTCKGSWENLQCHQQQSAAPATRGVELLVDQRAQLAQVKVPVLWCIQVIQPCKLFQRTFGFGNCSAGLWQILRARVGKREGGGRGKERQTCTGRHCADSVSMKRSTCTTTAPSSLLCPSCSSVLSPFREPCCRKGPCAGSDGREDVGRMR